MHGWVVLKPRARVGDPHPNREVQGRGTGPDALASDAGSAHTHTFAPFLPCRVTSCPGLSRAEEFPRRQDFQAKTGTVWGKPPPEAGWYFKQRDLKTEWRQK